MMELQPPSFLSVITRQRTYALPKRRLATAAQVDTSVELRYLTFFH